jgi:RNA ligase
VLLMSQLDSLLAAAAREAVAVAHLSDKEVGLRLNQFPAEVRSLIFPYRNQGGDLLSGRPRQMVFRAIRPTANELPGYVPSYAINRVMDESM